MQTLNTFFETQQNSPEWANSITKSAGFSQTKQAISNELTGFQIPQSFYEKLIMKLCEGLDIEIGDILVRGYRKHQEIVQFRNMENPPSGYHEVTLLEHTFVSKHSPKLQVLVNNVPRLQLTFNITLKLNLTGGILFIQDGKIMKASTGSCLGSGNVDFEGYTILKKETASYNLPGEIGFEPGIAI